MSKNKKNEDNHHYLLISSCCFVNLQRWREIYPISFYYFRKKQNRHMESGKIIPDDDYIT